MNNQDASALLNFDDIEQVVKKFGKGVLRNPVLVRNILTDLHPRTAIKLEEVRILCMARRLGLQELSHLVSLLMPRMVHELQCDDEGKEASTTQPKQTYPQPKNLQQQIQQAVNPLKAQSPASPHINYNSHAITRDTTPSLDYL